MTRLTWFGLLVCLLLGGTLLSVTHAPVAYAAAPIDLVEFDDPKMLPRYNELVEQLRCPKCLNTNIKGSNAPIAQDLRKAVARLLREGMSNDEILSYLHARYGDFVLYNPPFKPGTYFLWLGPIVFVLLAAVLIGRTIRRAQEQPPAPELDSAELAQALQDAQSKVAAAGALKP